METGSPRSQQLRMGLPQAPSQALSIVLCNVCTKGLADLKSNGLSRVLTLADDGLFYKTASDTHAAVTAVQERLEQVSQKYQETESEISPSKAQALWCTLSNKAVGQAMPAVSFNGEFICCANSLRYLGMHFDRMLTYKTQVESARLGCEKGQRNPRWKPWLQKASNSVICSCCIRVWYLVSLTMVRLGWAELLKGLRNFLNMGRPEHHSIDRLKERGLEKGSGRHSTLRGRERSVFNQTNSGTVLRAFPSTTMPSWAETETELNCLRFEFVALILYSYSSVLIIKS